MAELVRDIRKEIKEEFMPDTLSVLIKNAHHRIIIECSFVVANLWENILWL